MSHLRCSVYDGLWEFTRKTKYGSQLSVTRTNDVLCIISSQVNGRTNYLALANKGENNKHTIPETKKRKEGPAVDW